MKPRGYSSYPSPYIVFNGQTQASYLPSRRTALTALIGGMPACLIGSASGPALKLKQIATRTSAPLQQTTGNQTPFMCRTFHYARDNISSLKLIFANYFGATQQSTSGTLSVTASVEYPAGTITQVKFG